MVFSFKTNGKSINAQRLNFKPEPFEAIPGPGSNAHKRKGFFICFQRMHVGRRKGTFENVEFRCGQTGMHLDLNLYLCGKKLFVSPLFCDDL